MSSSSYRSYKIYLVKDLAQDTEVCQACRVSIIVYLLFFSLIFSAQTTVCIGRVQCALFCTQNIQADLEIRIDRVVCIVIAFPRALNGING